MFDIYFAIGVVTFISVIAGTGAYAFAKRASRILSISIAIVMAGLIVWNVGFFRHSLWPARVFPFTSMIVFADFNPEIGSILAGLSLALMPGHMARRMVLGVPLLGLCFWESFAPLMGTRPPLEDRSKHGFFLQTSQSSCAAAAAATLLAQYGIKTTEKEMAELCLTSLDGTSIRGVYRGLKIKTLGTPLQVEPFHGVLDTLRARKEPVMLTVQLNPGPGVDLRFQRDWGWAPGVSHSIVFLGMRADGRFDVCDPAVGREVWDKKAIDTLWHGEGIAIKRP